MAVDSERLAITWDADGGGALVLDAAISILPTHEAEITEHPVESGGSVVDHIAKRPVVVQVEGIIVNTPLRIVDDFSGGGGVTSVQRRVTISTAIPGAPQLGGATLNFSRPVEFTVDTTTAPLQRIEDVYGALVDAQNTARLHTLTFVWREFSNMVLQSFAPSHTPEQGRAMGVSLTFRSVTFAEAQRDAEVSRAPTTERAKRPKKQGKQQATEPTDAEEEKGSALWTLING